MIRTDATGKMGNARMDARTGSSSMLEEWNVPRDVLINVLRGSALKPAEETVTLDVNQLTGDLPAPIHVVIRHA